MTAPSERPLLALWGFMGSGKSTVGRRLAERAGARFCDLDEAIARAAGATIPSLFARHGEAHFRALERDAWHAEVEACQRAQAPTVVALGGGALLDPQSHALALAAAFVVTLTAEVDTVVARVAGSDRPLLAVADPRAAVARLLASRRDAYATTHAQLATDGRTPDQLVQQLLARWPGATPR